MTVHAFVDESARPPRYLVTERTLRRFLGPYPSGSQLVYEHLDSTSESLLWIADIAGWCFGAGAEWRKRIDPIMTAVVDLDGV